MITSAQAKFVGVPAALLNVLWSEAMVARTLRLALVSVDVCFAAHVCGTVRLFVQLMLKVAVSRE
jgi:hypothetical protein